MQYRMKTHQLAKMQMEEILNKAQVAVLATLNEDGSPYATPVHFVYERGKVFIHGLPAGQKVDNIKRNGTVSFNAYRMEGLLLDEGEKPCDTNTKYKSVIIQGNAELITDIDKKREILGLIIRKYTPHLFNKPVPDNMVNGTCVISIAIKEMTGKFWE